MYDLSAVRETDIAECGKVLSTYGNGAGSMEDVANRIVRYLYDNFTQGESDDKACTLVRLYKTHSYGDLNDNLKEFANGILGDIPVWTDTPCLTLMATAGEQADWNDRSKSSGHQAIPLPSEAFVKDIPMISRLVNQLGLEVRSVLKPDPAILVDLKERTFNVFHVEEAVGSPYIPAQDDFVIPYGVRSVLGFGGILSTGDLFVVILFSKSPISRDAAERFKPLAVDVKRAIGPFADGTVFN